MADPTPPDPKRLVTVTQTCPGIGLIRLENIPHDEVQARFAAAQERHAQRKLASVKAKGP